MITDLTRFGYRELGLASELLSAVADKGLPEDWDDEANTQLAFNENSGF